MKRHVLGLFAAGALVAMGAGGYSPVVNAGQLVFTPEIIAKHLHEMGGPNGCFRCHTVDGTGPAEPPPVLRGRYAHMGGPQHSCTDCHDGEKAPILYLPAGYESCGDCHPSR